MRRSVIAVVQAESVDVGSLSLSETTENVTGAKSRDILKNKNIKSERKASLEGPRV